jgi:hypothetical protein
VVAVVEELPVEHGLGEGAQQEAVVRGEQVQRRPHGHDAHEATLCQELRQPLGSESGETGPQRQVRILGHLRLQTDEMRHRVEWRHRRPPEEELAVQRGPVEGSEAQHVGTHPADRGRPVGPAANHSDTRSV